MSQRTNLKVLARAALNRRDEAAAVPVLTQWLDQNTHDTDIAHWLALLLRALDRRVEAIAVLEQALVSAPANPALAHVYAHISLEAGLPASRLFETAIGLAPDNFDARIGLVSARFAEGDGRHAMLELSDLLMRNPEWLSGHRTYAQLATMLGEEGQELKTLKQAQRQRPGNAALQQVEIDLLFGLGRWVDSLAVSEAALSRFGNQPGFVLSRAVAFDELSQTKTAAQIFAELGPAHEPGHAVRRLRHLLRIHALAQACHEIEPWLQKPGHGWIWPIAALAWRAAGDRRASWLEGQAGLIRIIDLDAGDCNIGELTPLLRTLHARSGRFLDQSVRNGTQTDGPLFARIEPAIRTLRTAIVRAVDAHIAGLPPFDPVHPALSVTRRASPRFAGSWSVRLTGSGHHSSHHHPQGWISSAFYVAVPESLHGEAGQLALGESPAELGLGLPPLHLIAPKVARLVMFPSFMWHATRPFSAGERISIAFDIAPT